MNPLRASMFGFLAAVTWGTADFAGGIVSRKSSSYRASFYGFLVGLVILAAVQLIYRPPLPGLRDLAWSGTAGLLGAAGLLLLLEAFAQGKMSIAAPVSALMGAVLPVIASAFTEGLPGWLKFGGIALALAAIWLISRGDGAASAVRIHLADLRLALLAGVAFGFYFILMHQGSQQSTLGPLLAARASGTLLLFIFAALKGELKLPGRKLAPIVLLNGTTDIFGNGFFILAGQAGRLDAAAVLGSLYPGMTVLLAALILHERLNRGQWLGITCALAAIALMTV